MKRNDPGHVETDKELAKLEKQISKEYTQAYKDVKQKFEKYMQDFDRKDKVKRELVKSGQLSQSEYIEWRRNQLLVGQRWEEMRDALAKDITNTQRIANSMTKEFLPDAYAINHNYGTFEVEKGSHINTSYTLYDRDTVNRLIRDNPKLLPAPKVDIPKAQLWNKRKLTSAITQGVLQGEAIPAIAKRLMTVTDMSKAAAIRNARTMTTSAECAGRIDSYKRAESMGIDMKQAWVATLDGRTRHEHRLLDGQIRPVGEPFEVEGQKIMYPGDPAAEPYLVYNCRCTVIALVNGTSLENGIGDYPRILDPKLGDMTYEQWKHAHEVAQEQEERLFNSDTSIGSLVAPQMPRRRDYNGDYEAFEQAREKYKQEKTLYNEAIDNAINNSCKQTAFNTKEELARWAEKNSIKINDAVYDEIDIRSFNEAKVALEEMFERFPEVKSYNFEYYDGSIIKRQFEIGVTNDGLLSANNGFNFNPRYFGNYEYGLREALESMTDGYLVRGDGSFKTLVRHEFGHNVDSYIKFKLADKYHDTVDDWRKNFKTFAEKKEAQRKYNEERDLYNKELTALAGLKGASEYSNTNTLELFAEGFAEYASGGKSEFAQEFGKFLKRWY